ncbi:MULTISPECIES: RidA family protein [Selenomonas]|uniref:RidA family protein n=4 Tax=Selenomonadaceae TaxID=1843491 RepID=UPI00067A0375|nr:MULTISPECIES: RidA family protein [Selenomonas]MBF1683391.1 RidA family protein [Selenomonas sp.]AKT53959.1 regulator [Selenomonas sp. oral taxon 478]MBF1686224.1 RidA family protein [Selenomonas sp.]MBF1688881.1 RidA family protein [Selenomonas sp.]MBF1692341.1 RidA family protein [Selenomonas sp.]
MEMIHSDNAPAALGPYSQAMRVGSLVYTSGQIGIDPAVGKITATDVAGQAEQVCKNLAAVLSAAGTDLSHTIKTTCFLADIADFAAFNEVYARHFTGKPARSCVAAKALPAGALCEIEVIAEV